MNRFLYYSAVNVRVFGILEYVFCSIVAFILSACYFITILLKKKYLIEIPERTSLPNIFYTILLNGVVDILQRIPIQLIGAGNLRQLCIF